jgi:hypothetical protein
MEQKQFSKQEAESKMGRAIRSLGEFPGVPKGTPGRVVDLEEMGRAGFAVVVEWDLPQRQFTAKQEPIRDWFIKEEYERFLVEG